MLMTVFSCTECATRVESTVSSALLHCPVCENVLHDEDFQRDKEISEREDAAAKNADLQPEAEVTQELERIDREWDDYQQTHLFSPTRGPARVPSKRRSLVKVGLLAVPIVLSLQQLFFGHPVIGLVVLLCAGFGVYHAAREYIMAENRELAEFVYERKREYTLSGVSCSGRRFASPQHAP